MNDIGNIILLHSIYLSSVSLTSWKLSSQSKRRWKMTTPTEVCGIYTAQHNGRACLLRGHYAN